MSRSIPRAVSSAIGLALFVTTLCAHSAAGQLTVAPASLAAALDAGEATTLTFELANSGSSAVDVRLSVRRAGSNGSGLLWANLFGIDPATGSIVETRGPLPRPAPGEMQGSAFDGEALYFTPGGSTVVYRLARGSFEVLEAMRLPFGVRIDGLAHTGRALYASEYEGNFIHELDLHTGRVVRSIPTFVDIIGGLTAGGTRGTLFVATNNDGGILELDPVSGEIRNTLPVPGFLLGLAYSQELGVLFAAHALGPGQSRIVALDPDNGSELYEVPTGALVPPITTLAADEAVGAAAWLAATRAVTVPAGGAADIDVALDTQGLVAGHHAGEIAIHVADEAYPSVVVPIDLTINGTPAVSAVPGGLDFDQIFSGATAIRSLTIRNDGTDALHVSSVTPTHPTIGLDQTAFTLAPGRDRVLEVSIRPLEIGALTASILFASDDPARPSLSVPVAAAVAPAPVFVSSADTLRATAAPGERTTVALTLTNTGRNPLAFAPFAGTTSLMAPGRETPNGYLPAAGTDEVGDAVGGPDLMAIRAAVLGDTIFFEYAFADVLGIDDAFRLDLYLDVDQDSSTGDGQPTAGGLTPVVGAEFLLVFEHDFNSVWLFNDEVSERRPVVFDGSRLRFSVPLNLIGDDGRMDVAAIVRVGHALTDPLADGASFSLGGPTWLGIGTSDAFDPVPPGEGVELSVTLDASRLGDGLYESTLLLHTNAPAASALGPDVLVPVLLTVRSPTANEDVPVASAAGFALHPVYPNPVGVGASVQFDLSRSSPVAISIHDVLGRVVRVLVDGELPAGRHERSFDGLGLAGGTYFVRMHAGAYTATQSFALVRR